MAVADDQRCVAVLLYVIHHKVEQMIEMQSGHFLDRICTLVGFQRGTVAQFLCDDRADAGIRGIDRLCKLHRFGKDALAECILCGRERVELFLCLCNKIRTAGKYLAYGAGLCGYTLDAVNDRAVVIAENEIAVLAHQLEDKILAAEIAHLV